jgi:hypothetical protein
MKEQVYKRNYTASGQFQNQYLLLGINVLCFCNGKYTHEIMVNHIRELIKYVSNNSQFFS